MPDLCTFLKNLPCDTFVYASSCRKKKCSEISFLTRFARKKLEISHYSNVDCSKENDCSVYHHVRHEKINPPTFDETNCRQCLRAIIHLFNQEKIVDNQMKNILTI